MPNLEQMKQFLYSHYPAKSWQDRLSKMSDNQIIAIWYALQKADNKSKPKPSEEKFVQLPLSEDMFRR